MISKVKESFEKTRHVKKYSHYHLKLSTPPLHRQFFLKSSHSHDYIQTYCIDRRNPFLFACRQWYSCYNPQF